MTFNANQFGTINSLKYQQITMGFLPVTPYNNDIIESVVNSSYSNAAPDSDMLWGKFWVGSPNMMLEWTQLYLCDNTTC